MSKAGHVPQYRLHKSTGYAYVWHPSIPTKGHRLYLGKHGTPQSQQRYRQFLERLALNNSGAEVPLIDPIPTIDELVLAWVQYGKEHYKRGDGMSTQYGAMRRALRLLVKYHGADLAQSFGPKKLKDLRRGLIKRYARSYVNQTVFRIQRFYQWASSEELIPAAHYHGLTCVKPLAKNELGARDNPRVRPVPLENVLALLPFLSPTVSALVQTQYLCCMRPREACIMRACDIDRTGPCKPPYLCATSR
jgi:integrase